ncbi:MAG: winged helix-turn-helix domain-containing protein [Pseudomonadota bacterium]
MTSQTKENFLDMTVQFADFEFNPSEHTLLHLGDRVAIEPQSFAILNLLLAHPNQLVTRDQLLDQVWGHRYVTDSALSTQIKAVRQALGDTGRERKYVETVRGKGFRFIAEVLPISPPTEPAGMTNLGVERTPLIGREAEKTELLTLLRSQRWVSVLGLGGVGKTRLVKAVGHEAVRYFADGVWWIDLVAASDSDAVFTAIAHTLNLGIHLDEGVGALAEHLADRQLLLILDNCEHIVEEVAFLMNKLLESTRQPKFLTTSRVPLSLPDEQRLVLLPLTTGDAAGALGFAEQLFVREAQRHGFVLTDDQIPEVTALCQSLDGLPLAIQLAAAQLRIYNLSELQQKLDARLSFVGTTNSPSPERNNLGAVLDSMWHTLSKTDQTLLAYLVAFPSDFSAMDAEAMFQNDAFALSFAHLADCSLISRGDGQSWRLLETVNLFCAQNSSEAQRHQGEQAHAHWVLDRIDVARNLYSRDTARWCEARYDDIQQAQLYFRSVDQPELAAEVCAGTALAMHFDPGARASIALNQINDYLALVQDPTRLARLHIAAIIASKEPSVAYHHGSESLEIAQQCEDDDLKSLAITMAAWTKSLASLEQGDALFDEAIELAQNANNPLYADLALCYRAGLMAASSRFEEASNLAKAIVERGEQNPDPTYPYYAASTVLLATVDSSNSDELDLHIQRVRDFGMRHWATELVTAVVLAEAGQVGTAMQLCRTIHEQVSRTGASPWPELLIGLAAIADAQGHEKMAAEWLAAVRQAPIPSRTLQTVIAYRRVRERLKVRVQNTETLDQTIAQATRWLTDSTDDTETLAPPDPKRFDNLSDREDEVLREMAQGATNQQIAAQLAISDKTVRNHVTQILRKLQVESRVNAILLAKDMGY